jgi:hypothetical protein
VTIVCDDETPAMPIRPARTRRRPQSTDLCRTPASRERTGADEDGEYAFGWLAGAVLDGAIISVLANAPREIRTPTVRTDHKALNLARLSPLAILPEQAAAGVRKLVERQRETFNQLAE